MIEINNLSDYRIRKRFLKNIARKILKKEISNFKEKNIELSIVLLKERESKKINLKYRKKNRSTDVLSFGESKELKEEKFPSPLGKEKRLGEILLCPVLIKKNAKKFKNPFKKEMTRVLIHGVLHILGYDHERSGREAIEMMEKENNYLSTFFK